MVSPSLLLQIHLGRQQVQHRRVGGRGACAQVTKTFCKKKSSKIFFSQKRCFRAKDAGAEEGPSRPEEDRPDLRGGPDHGSGRHQVTAQVEGNFDKFYNLDLLLFLLQLVRADLLRGGRPRRAPAGGAPAGPGHQPVLHPGLHLRHHGQPQGRHAVPRQRLLDRPERPLRGGGRPERRGGGQLPPSEPRGRAAVRAVAASLRAGAGLLRRQERAQGHSGGDAQGGQADKIPSCAKVGHTSNFFGIL